MAVKCTVDVSHESASWKVISEKRKDLMELKSCIKGNKPNNIFLMFNDTVCIIVGMVEKLSWNVFIMIEKIGKFSDFH